ncbi:high mobility group nucleosome-binding domain-containing protein 5-like [Carassius auratus]|uniref:High mobility group nucleosome-binding domain-containing protein 5-like n=1 Tax=Carassius auratus TaxID=7957 RepID=A0A6P6J3T5_CARAU|nr:high mobility group nucleosome-binding domain-containing protein 5-like [Carassius auratus]
MTTVNLVPQDLAGRLEWIDPTQCRCSSEQIPWHEIRVLTSVVNLRICEGAEIPPFIYSNRGGRDGSPKVRVFDEYGGEVRSIPTRGWDELDETDAGEGSERGSVAPSFVPRREENRNALDFSAPQQEVPESPDDESESEDEEPLKTYFGKEKQGDLGDCDSEMWQLSQIISQRRKQLNQLREEIEQEQFEEKWRTVGSLTACQEIAEKGVEGILRHIFQGVKRNALAGAKEFLLYGPETSPEELERALIRYDRKTEIIQTDKEKSGSKTQRSKDPPRRSSREKKPYNRYEVEGKFSPHPEQKPDRNWRKGRDRFSPKDSSHGGRKYRDQSKPRDNRPENNREKSNYITPEKWNKLSSEVRQQIMEDRQKSRPEARIGRVRTADTRAEASVEKEEAKAKRKKNKKKGPELTEA